MELYKYRIYNKFSTAQSDILNENRERIGFMKKFYNNPLERLVDFIGSGNLITRYVVNDNNNQIVFKSKRGNPFRWRKYYGIYFNNGKEYQITLAQKDFIKISDHTEFIFEGSIYDMKKEIGDWAKIIDRKNGKIIAKWKICFVNPFYAQFEIIDDDFEGHELFFIGLFHTYFYGE